jgi:hypothetical protein
MMREKEAIMGIHIDAISGAKLVGRYDALRDDGGRSKAEAQAAGAPVTYCGNIAFPARMDGLRRGFYTFEAAHDGPSFSYDGYSTFRERLATCGTPDDEDWADSYLPTADSFFGPDEENDTEAPFYPLINMSDCEGAIGPNTCQRLYTDFAEREAVTLGRAKSLLPADEYLWFEERYRAFKEAFAFAAGTGFVRFL